MITMSSFKYAGLIISIIISLISCTHNKNYPTAFQPELAKAEAMMYRYPDSALHILQGIQPDIPSIDVFITIEQPKLIRNIRV